MITQHKSVKKDYVFGLSFCDTAVGHSQTLVELLPAENSTIDVSVWTLPIQEAFFFQGAVR